MTPLDIANESFRTHFRGFGVVQVRDFQQRAANAMEELLTENASLRNALEHLQEQVARTTRLEETLQKTLLLAQRAADETRNSAQREAESLRRRAETDADEIRNAAWRDLMQLRGEMAELTARRNSFVAEWHAHLTAQAGLLQRTPTMQLDAAELQRAQAALDPEQATDAHLAEMASDALGAEAGSFEDDGGAGAEGLLPASANGSGEMANGAMAANGHAAELVAA
jgi:cell division initiation protein